MILFVAVLIAIFVGWYLWPRSVNLKLISSIQSSNFKVNSEVSDFNSELHWWFIDSIPEKENTPKLGTVSPDLNSKIITSSFTDWGIDFDELGIDFNKNNVILTFSREIKEMKFKRADWFPYKTISTVKTMMSKKFEQNTIYIYMIPKYDVREDLRAYTETSLEK